MSEFGRGINEFQVDLRLFSIEGGGEERVSKDKSSLSDTDGATFKHDVVIKDASVMRETSERGNVLLSDISFSSGIVIGFSGGFTDSVDSLVEFSSVMVTVLSGSGNSPSDSFGMPCSDATDLSETLVCLSGELSDSVSGGNSFVSMSLGDSDNISETSSGEDVVNSDFLFEVGVGPFDFLFNSSSIDLDFK